MSYLISRRYARALLDVSLEAGREEVVYRDMKAIMRLMDDSWELRGFVHNPTVSREKRRRILDGIFIGRVDPLTHRFVRFLDEKGRLPFLRSMGEAFERLYLRYQGIAKVKITTPSELNAHQAQRVVQHLQSRWGAPIEPHLETDAGLVGGVRIQWGDTVYDYSLRAQLEKFQKNVSGASSLRS
jgi:F-type H+-transporting ATPase subunit delta